MVTQRAAVRRHIGLVFQEATLDDYLTAEQNLGFHAAICGCPETQRVVLELVGLSDRRPSLVRTFSGGLKRRLEMPPEGCSSPPRVLFLDEPTIGLDPESRLGLWCGSTPRTTKRLRP